MRAIVKEAFDGVVDGEILPTTFAIGDVIIGDLAVTAVKLGLADEAPAEGGPTGYAALSWPELRKHAAERGVDLTANKGKEQILVALAALDAAKPAEAGASA
jgi:hypothetical protein